MAGDYINPWAAGIPPSAGREVAAGAVKMDEENQRFSSRKAVVAALLLAALAFGAALLFLLVLSQRACATG